MNRSQFEHLNAGQQYSHHTCSEYELAMHLMTLSPQAAGYKIKTVSTKSTQISQPHVDLVSAGSKPFVHAMYTRRKEVVKTALHYITSHHHERPSSTILWGTAQLVRKLW